jgi:hypothetical protein
VPPLQLLLKHWFDEPHACPFGSFGWQVVPLQKLPITQLLSELQLRKQLVALAQSSPPGHGPQLPPTHRVFPLQVCTEVQKPLMHDEPTPQALPQTPQFNVFVEVLTQVPEQEVSPCAQAAHCPAMQAVPLHDVPHVPQLLGSEFVLVRTIWPTSNKVAPTTA